jgi:hypothetical protein
MCCSEGHGAWAGKKIISDCWSSFNCSCLLLLLYSLQALPNGHISPALFVALRVLCAPDEEAAGWSSIADALCLPAVALDSSSDEQGQPELGAVQVWPVLNCNGQPLAANVAAAEMAGITSQPAAAAGGEEARQLILRSAQLYSTLLNSAMCELLQGAVRLRLQAYGTPLKHDLQQLEAAPQHQEAPAAATAAEEQRVAERSALLLRITEKEVLHDLLTALERRLEVTSVKEKASEGPVDAAVSTKRQLQRQKVEGRKETTKRKAAGMATIDTKQQNGSGQRQCPKRK